MTELEEYIKGYFNAPATMATQLSELFSLERIPKGAFFSQQGDRYIPMSFIKSGYLRIFSQADGKEVTQWVSSQGEFVTDLKSILFQEPSRWTIQALTDCELYTISNTNYQQIDTLIPEWYQIERLFIGKCFLTIEERIFSFLSLSAEERYKLLYSEKQDLFRAVPLQYIASMLGMTPETFSRIRKKLLS